MFEYFIPGLNVERAEWAVTQGHLKFGVTKVDSDDFFCLFFLMWVYIFLYVNITTSLAFRINKKKQNVIKIFLLRAPQQCSNIFHPGVSTKPKFYLALRHQLLVLIIYYFKKIIIVVWYNSLSYYNSPDLETFDLIRRFWTDQNPSTR